MCRQLGLPATGECVLMSHAIFMTKHFPFNQTYLQLQLVSLVKIKYITCIKRFLIIQLYMVQILVQDLYNHCTQTFIAMAMNPH